MLLLVHNDWWLFIALCQSASLPFAGTPKLLGHYDLTMKWVK